MRGQKFQGQMSKVAQILHGQPFSSLGCSDFQTFRLSDFQTFRLSDFQTFRLSDFQTFRLWTLRPEIRLKTVAFWTPSISIQSPTAASARSWALPVWKMRPWSYS